MTLKQLPGGNAGSQTGACFLLSVELNYPGEKTAGRVNPKNKKQKNTMKEINLHAQTNLLGHHALHS